ncbi:MAG: cytochrome c oxidase assembly protein [Gemmataceae bacterium]
MDQTLEAFLLSWSFDPWVVVPTLLGAACYGRGWLALRRRGLRRFGALQLTCFLLGLASLFVALASPLDPFSFLLLQVHMIQHLLLMMVAPPLLWLGAPLLPMLRGLPVAIRRHWVSPFLRLPVLRRAFAWLTRPVVAWILFIAATWLWHVPALYERALVSDGWHYLQHACFLVTGLLFWYPVVQPYPARPAFEGWILIPYLILADVQNTALSALFAFAEKLLYPHYAEQPTLWGIAPLQDQATAGVIMWVPGSLIYLVPLVFIGHRLLQGGTPEHPRRFPAKLQRISLPVTSTVPAKGAATSQLDVLDLPLVGRFLRWRHARLTVQLLTFGLAAVIIADGLCGPQVGAMNLAGVVPWIHWRGLVVLALLGAGNVFCMACPFLLPRRIAKRLFRVNRAWPRPLRSKWLAVALLVLFFWAYEAFGLWDSPWWTAWIALGYFVLAFAVDAFFRDAAFCKYLCPIGQFQFVNSLASPFEVKVRDAAGCLQCATKDCIRGNETSTGCELHLFVPRKSGNLDCTFCLDCIQACPHDNVGIVATPPGAALLADRHRSGIGTLSRRLDLAALAAVVVFAGFANAAGMVAPIVDLEYEAMARFGWTSPLGVISLFQLGIMLVLPAVLLGLAACLSRSWSRSERSLRQTVCRFVYVLVPIGFGMWLAHYSFHFFSSADAVIPVTQRAAADLGLNLGEPAWGACCCVVAAPWLLKLEILFLDVGLLLSLYLAFRLAAENQQRLGPTLRGFVPWAAVILILFAAGLWILFQPMEMRGLMQG